MGEFNQALEKHSTVETPRPPLVPAERNDGNTRRSRTREVSSRYRSPSPSAASGPRRYPSPNTRTGMSSNILVPKRAISAERKRPSTPPSLSSPSTPVPDTTKVIQLASRKLTSSRLPEALWPSTMRSPSAAFQSDTFSLPPSKQDKPVTHAVSDRTLRPSLNVVHKQSGTPPASRNSTPERKRSPLKGKNAPDQSENSKPVDSLHGRLVDQHRWPSSMGRRVSSNASAESFDLLDRISKYVTTPHLGMTAPSSRRMSIPGGWSKPLEKTSSDAFRLLSLDGSANLEFEASSVDDKKPRMLKVASLRSSERTNIVSPIGRTQSLPSPGSRPASPKKAPLLSSSVSRGASPSRIRTLTSAPSRGVSPSRTRSSSPYRQANSSTSVLSYIVDIRKGMKVANRIEDVHHLRLLYNNHLQWRYASAQAEVALNSQKKTSETALYSVWRTTSELWDSIIQKRIGLQLQRLKLKLYCVINEQLAYLNEWPFVEKDHTRVLSGVIRDLQASTLRLPATGGARGDMDTVKAAICSAIDVMQTMGSVIHSTLSKVEQSNFMVSELANVAAQERAMLDECEALLATTAAMQVEEYSLRTHLVQLKQTWNK